MNTLPPGRALVRAELENEGVNDAVTCEVRGKGGDVMLCVARLLQSMAAAAGVPVVIMALEVVRIAEKIPAHTSINLDAIAQARGAGDPAKE